MYGALIMGNVSFYSDLFYRKYVVMPYHSLGLIREDNMWPAIEFFRVLFTYSVWLIAGMFWAATFIGDANIFILFQYITTGLIWWSAIRMFLIIIAQCIALLYDMWDRTYGSYPDMFQDAVGWGAEATHRNKEMVDQPWIDIELEMLNVGMQFLAYPLYNYSINNFWRQEKERVEAEENGTYVRPTTRERDEATTKENRRDQQNAQADNNNVDDSNDF
jgi:hypothetical protein